MQKPQIITEAAQSPDFTSLSPDALIAEINVEHGKASDAATIAMGHAVKIGEMLVMAKSQIKHGEWVTWVTDNLSFGERQARKYMQVFDGKDAIDSKRNCGADLSINAAIKLLAPPEPEPEPFRPFDLPTMAEYIVLHGINVEWFDVLNWFKGEKCLMGWYAVITPITGKDGNGKDGIFYNIQLYSDSVDEDGKSVYQEDYNPKGLPAAFVSYWFDGFDICRDEWRTAKVSRHPHHGKNQWLDEEPSPFRRITH